MANADPATAGLRPVGHNRNCRKLEDDPELADREGGDGDVKNKRNKD